MKLRRILIFLSIFSILTNGALANSSEKSSKPAPGFVDEHPYLFFSGVLALVLAYIGCAACESKKDK